jgi:hypothetical protein
MLGLVGQKLAHLVPRQGIALTAACAICAQIVMVPTAMLAGSMADRWGRKPLFAAAFFALALRGALYPLSDQPAWLVSVQLLDGVGAGLTGALFPVIVSDLTRGSGHFGAAQAHAGPRRDRECHARWCNRHDSGVQPRLRHAKRNRAGRRRAVLGSHARDGPALRAEPRRCA